MNSSNGNGVIRVGRKGKKQFAFGEDGEPFEVDVVVAFQQWIDIDGTFREGSTDRTIPNGEMARYHQAAAEFVKELARSATTDEKPEITIAEALDFIARLREQYDEVADFFAPKSRAKRESPDTSPPALTFSAEEN